MNRKKQAEKAIKGAETLNYIIGFTLVGILVVGSFFLPQLYNYRIDNKNLNTIHYQTREVVAFEGNIEIPSADRIAIMVNLINEYGMNPSLLVQDGEMDNDELLNKVREEIAAAMTQGMLPGGLTKYPLDGSRGILTMEYFNVNSNASELGEMTLWSVHYTDYETFEFRYLVDAQTYKIYYAEFYYDGAEEDWKSTVFAGDDNLYMDRCLAYYETEHYYSILGSAIFEMDDCGAFGWFADSNPRWKFGKTGVVLGFDPFLNYFSGRTLEDEYGMFDEYHNENLQEEQENANAAALSIE